VLVQPQRWHQMVIFIQAPILLVLQYDGTGLYEATPLPPPLLCQPLTRQDRASNAVLSTRHSIGS